MADTVPEADDAPGAVAAPRGGRRRRTVLIAAAAVVVAAVAAVGALGLGGGGGEGPDAPPRAGSLVPVTRATLTERTRVDGRLGYGTEMPLPLKATGTVTWLPEPGTVVRRGGTLLRVDDRPVVLLYGSLPMYRALGAPRAAAPSPSASPSASPPADARKPAAVGAAAATQRGGMDVLQFETNLAALGYTGFTVDEKYTAATAAAVERWQTSLGVPATGTVGIGDVVYSAGKVRIGRPGVRLGAAAGENALAYTGTARKVVVDASAAEAGWAVRGTAVRVRLPDGRHVKGAVASVGRQASAPEGGSGEDGSERGAATLPVTIAIADQKSLGRLESGPVTVEYVGREAADVLTVPVAALVALAEGGHRLETADGRFVPVRTGLFADGRVEVSGPAVRAGLKVRIPE
ncbi:peptidoglycan-binding domain-containing protein [Actinomadura bangladeshensis]|uniref:Peptidoglycan-binding protein n=1 Tax=Actinomadura bangladeshensis TaxID=453573 RepID=A0A4R4NWR2_9ACTN|nr:peptidoglycan-binding domain-containing protein [Actinomadura bangladeshensis]TDC13975.1 peptidoglycan-binding protein [Actinomadura bangladeshensis]